MFNFFEELKKEFKLQPNPLTSYNLVMISSNLIYLEGHKGLLKLSQDNISLKIKKGVVCVLGKSLKIVEMTKKTITISGIISNIEVL